MDLYIYFLNMLCLENNLYSTHIQGDIQNRDRLDIQISKYRFHYYIPHWIHMEKDYMDHLFRV